MERARLLASLRDLLLRLDLARGESEGDGAESTRWRGGFGDEVLSFWLLWAWRATVME